MICESQFVMCLVKRIVIGSGEKYSKTSAVPFNGHILLTVVTPVLSTVIPRAYR